MQHKIMDFITAFFAVRIGVQGCQQGRPPLHPHADIERPALFPVCHPRAELTDGEPFLGLGDRLAAYAVQNKLMPYLVELGQLFGFPRLFTSLMTPRSAIVRL